MERSVQLHALHELVDLVVFSPLLCRQEHHLGFGYIELACAQEPVERKRQVLGWMDERIGRKRR
jgi:hypothetical protein